MKRGEEIHRPKSCGGALIPSLPARWRQSPRLPLACPRKTISLKRQRAIGGEREHMCAWVPCRAALRLFLPGPLGKGRQRAF